MYAFITWTKTRTTLSFEKFFHRGLRVRAEADDAEEELHDICLYAVNSQIYPGVQMGTEICSWEFDQLRWVVDLSLGNVD